MCRFCRDLRKKIQFYRKTLIETGINKGLQDPETLKNSQILDELIFRYQSKCK
ncbi:aspartyl-phosphate phosphatase Spo0E family protein [Bacillus sp. J33]|uniref:aspartyl-phosphate phosphatase Spo0E family protein n=1 Tax=Bacillus sp. J33 TaxID=935836 RepID=UPI0009FF8E2C|nr:aspartyl-phosphate phosphatase Spo0E family protein [Bacillus sp. J33]